MDTQAMLQSTYLDVIFEGRNKAYGGYVLRYTYAQRMHRAGVIMIVLCGLILINALLQGHAKDQTLMMPHSPVVSTDTILMTHIEIALPKPLLPDKTIAAADPVKTTSYTAPQVVRDVPLKLDQTLASKDDLKDAVAGLKTQDGTVGVNDAHQTSIIGGSGGGELLGTGSSDKNTVYAFTELDPEFPGGKEALYAYLAEHVQYPPAALNAGKEGKVLVKFVVNEDGSVSQVTVLRGFGYGSEQEAERVINGMPHWQPGRNNNKPVKVWFQVPIFFKLN